MRRKALKQKKNLESSPFWNPESTELESGIQYPESGIHRVESRIQDCHGFPYMGRFNVRMFICKGTIHKKYDNFRAPGKPTSPTSQKYRK